MFSNKLFDCSSLFGLFLRGLGSEIGAQGRPFRVLFGESSGEGAVDSGGVESVCCGLLRAKEKREEKEETRGVRGWLEDSRVIR